MNIRAATAADVDAILAVWSAADAHPTVTDTAADVARLLRDQPGALLVAELDGPVVGTVVAAWDGWRGNLYRLAVVPGARRRGVGHELVREAVDRLRARGARRISLFVVAADEGALAFWDSLESEGLHRDPLPKIRYVWNLSAPDVGPIGRPEPGG